MFSKNLHRIISRNPYTKEWRMKTAICLFALGMPETGIQNAITGNLDKRKECYNLCQAEGLDFQKVWELLK